MQVIVHYNTGNLIVVMEIEKKLYFIYITLMNVKT